MGYKNPRYGMKTVAKNGWINTATRKPGPYWVLDYDPLFDLDMVNGRVFGPATLTSALTLSRASSGTWQNGSMDWLSFASGVLRRTDRGLLIEEARTNSVRNSIVDGSVAGIPGTLPNLWSVNNGSTLSRQIVGRGISKGLPYTDIRFFGTAAGGFVAIDPDNGYSLATASPGQVWTYSAFLALVGGSLDNISTFQVAACQFGGTGQNNVNLMPNSTLTRYSSVYTMAASATAAFGRIGILFGTGPVDFTLRIAAPVTELGGFAMSPVISTGSSALRAADSIIAPALYPMLDMTDAGIFAQWEELYGPTGTDRYVWSFRVDGNNWFGLRISNLGRVFFDVIVATVIVSSLFTGNVVAAGNKYKVAVAWNASRIALRSSASLVNPANAAFAGLPAGTPVFNIGQQNNGNGGYLNASLIRLAGYKGLTDAQMNNLVL